MWKKNVSALSVLNIIYCILDFQHQEYPYFTKSLNKDRKQE